MFKNILRAPAARVEVMMRYPPDHAACTRDRVLISAKRLFARSGYERVSIDAVMADAGLTRGAFYRHFSSKGQLYALAMTGSCATSAPSAATPLEDWLAEQRLGQLAADARSAIPEVRAAARRRLRLLQGHLHQALTREVAADDAAADTKLAATALLVGTLALAQAQAEPAAREQLVAAGLDAARALLAPARPVEPSYFWAPAKDRDPSPASPAVESMEQTHV